MFARMTFCHGCQRCRPHERYYPSIMPHVALSVITLGLWVPILMFVGVFGGGYYCKFCGRKK